MPPKNKAKKNNAVAKSAVTTVSKPAANGTKMGARPQPKVRTSTRGVRIAHTEYIRDIYSAVNPGSLTSLSINPQSTAVFTWLASIATRYEMYRFHKLKFHYKPSCGTSEPGFVALGFDFEVTDPEPSKAVMLTWRYSAKSPAWESQVLDVSPDSRLSAFKYNQDYKNQSGLTDARLDFLGRLFVICSGTGSFVGELFIEYDVELIQPAYRVPLAISQSMFGGSLTTAGGYQLNSQNVLADARGNLDYVPDGSNAIIIYSVGEYLLELTQAWASSAANFLITAAADEAVFQLFETTNFPALTQTGLGARYERGLRIDVGPIRVTFVPPTGITGGVPWNFRLATAFSR